MSGLRDKAREIKAAGEAERGNFEPTGAPKRIYNYWLSETNSRKGMRIRLGDQKENFCHFWRVVVIWAPFMFFRRTVGRILSNPVVLGGLVAALLAFVIWAGITWAALGAGLLIALGGVIGLGLVLFSIFSGVSMAQKDDDEREEWDLPPARVAKWGAIIFPTFLIAYGFTKAIKSDYDVYFIAGIMVLFFGGFLTSIAVEEGILAALAVIGFILAIAAGLLLVLLACFFLSDFVTGLRATRKMKAREAREEYFVEHGTYPELVVRKPNKFKKFLSSVGDMVVFVAQVLRVKKWKICPTVDINK
jgi:hypothetical protein